MLQVFAKAQKEKAARSPRPGIEGRSLGTSLDLPLHATLGRLTAGIPPVALAQVYADWAQHLMLSPNKQAELVLNGPAIPLSGYRARINRSRRAVAGMVGSAFGGVAAGGFQRRAELSRQEEIVVSDRR